MEDIKQLEEAIHKTELRLERLEAQIASQREQIKQLSEAVVEICKWAPEYEKVSNGYKKSYEDIRASLKEVDAKHFAAAQDHRDHITRTQDLVNITRLFCVIADENRDGNAEQYAKLAKDLYKTIKAVNVQE